MRRILVTVAAATTILAVTPGLAMAHKHHRRHHRSHHAAQVHHRRSSHHRQVRHERFGKASTSDQSTGTAGTVTSFENGVLTITLTDGSTVSGAVDNSTEIECTAPANMQNSGDNDGDDNGGSNQGEDNGGSNQGEDNGGNQGDAGDDQGDNGDNQGDNGDNQGEDNNEDNAQMCDSSSLTTGTPVSEAELKVSSAGAVWQKVELMSAS